MSDILRGAIFEAISNSTGHFQAVEHLGSVLRLHVLVHGDEALEACGLGLVLLLGRGRDARLDALHLLDAALDAFFRGFQKALANVDFPSARFDFLAPALKPLEDRALGRRHKLTRLWDCDVPSLRCFGCCGIWLVFSFFGVVCPCYPLVFGFLFLWPRPIR